MGVFVKHVACDKCGSSDGLAVYDDDSMYCWVCNYTVPSKEYLQDIQESKSKVQVKSKGESKLNQVVQSTKPAISQEEVKEIKDATSTKCNSFRGLRDDVTTYFGVRHAFNEEGEVIEQYYPCTQDGGLVGFKIRGVPKSFHSTGRTGADCELFGAFRFNRGGKYVLLVEGECFDGETEILTEKGFKRFDSLDKSLKVAQYCENSKNIEYVHPIRHVEKDYDGNMVKISSKFLDVFCTEKHNLFYRNSKGIGFKAEAHERVANTNFFETSVLHSGKGVQLSDDQISLILAVCADGSISGRPRKNGDRPVHFGFRKSRKIERLAGILDRLGIDYTTFDNVYSDGRNYTTFNFILPEWIKDKSIPRDWLTQCTLEQKKFIVNEMSLWDGNTLNDRDGVEFSSKHFEEADTIYQIAVTSGYHCSIGKRENSLGVWYRTRVSFNKRGVSTQQLSGKKEMISYSGKVYCVTVPTGLIVIRRGGKTLVVGNCDQLSAYQMLKEYRESKGSDFETAVVSPTTGAQSVKQIAANYKFLDSFENIILCMDNDKAGQEAIDKLLPVLPKGKVKIMEMRYKDPNEYLCKGESKKFIQDFYAAKARVPAGVLPSDQLYDLMMSQIGMPRLPFPRFMGSLNDFFRGGIPTGHIINIAAATSLGKTTLVNELIYYWIFNSPYRVGIVSMELNSGQYTEALLSRHIGRKLALIESDEEKLEYLSRPDVQEKAQELLKDSNGDPRFYLLDNRDANVQEIQDTIEELVISCGCRVIVIDVLQDIIASLPNEEQELFLKWSKSMIKSHNIIMIYVNHTRKTKSGENAADDESSIHGSSSIIKSASVNIMLKRDKMSPCEYTRNKTEILVHKNRVYGITGPAGAVYYDNETHTLHNFDEWMREHGMVDF